MTATPDPDNDKPTPDPATPEMCLAPAPRLRVMLDGAPSDVVALLRLMAESAKGGKRGPKLGPEVARVMRQRLAAGETKQALAQEHGIAVASVENIASGRAYPEPASS
jgi:hypothetical protein